MATPALPSPLSAARARSRASAPRPGRLLAARGALRRWLSHPRVLFVALGFALRLTWVLVVPSRPVGDFALYRESAAYLLEHRHLDPEFIYMPGYVILLAAVQSAGGGLLAQKMLGVFSGTVLIAASAGIADRLFGRRAGVTAAALLALWPAGIAVSSVTGTDVPAGALVASGIFALLADVSRRLSAVGRERARATTTTTTTTTTTATTTTTMTTTPTAGPMSAGPMRTRSLGARVGGIVAGVVVPGVILGLAGWVRAVAIPLTGLSALMWRASGLRWRHAIARAILAVGVAVLVLVPWGLRNRQVYGRWFLTDNHGGHTALVGANPNSEGTYSRSLNVLFTRGTGFRLFDVPARHRDSDAVAYALARRWAAFEPAYAFGLLGAKADRLLTHERNLLYWPIYRVGVLDSGLPGVPGTADGVRAWFDRHRVAVERVADGFWWAISALAVAGLALGFLRLRRSAAWVALAVAAFPCALALIYTVFFSEVRYHLAIAPLLFPYAAFALTWLFLRARDRFRGDGRALGVCAAVVGVVLLGYATALAVATGLRARHRWAVSVCQLPDPRDIQLCSWRRLWPADGDSPLRGVWNGVGMRLERRVDGRSEARRDKGDDSEDLWAAIETPIELPAGRYRVRARLALIGAPPPPPSTASPVPSPEAAPPTVALRAGPTVFARALFGPPAADAAGNAPGARGVATTSSSIEGVIDHPGGVLALQVEVESPASASIVDGKTLWISDLAVERFAGLEIIAPQ